ncbi:MAG: glucose-1-phosphate thymidylyltransferase RfbA [Candidatus Marinimicrobia bacterium]|jgi:glucose-1-phosphate thymidylyltransferase|nr:glucose-1-phosphate thymidylyltransferase RfbA [Candidatus Neomarinimicrobiota bacterium]MBT4684445.1 glucose-1-phosphate thymidylyltransferase RfbA [Candidatus Neomarinimicrobiota bacterium]MBT7269547.1 glucose-1-phosphate thymidylyltransferase RfbA [Candidatus Neomarinimicrobiota bacterium]MBT7901260.1 glucose-1-phosphate thymidylyltransferase RfbA [Candidatus Neomarinimicrobiota bacterium]
MKGIILAGGSGTRLYPITKGVSKQLLPIYDKPMVYYPLSILMLSGIKDILIISTPDDTPVYEHLLGDGSQIGLQVSYKVQPSPDGLAQAFILGEEFIGDNDVCLILGDNVFYGGTLPERLINAVHTVDSKNNAVVFGYNVTDPERYGVVEFDQNGKAISIEEKPENPKSNYAISGLYFYPNDVVEVAKNQKPSPRGELEITDVNRDYLSQGRLEVECMGRGYAWLDTGTHDSLLEASQFVQTLEKRQGMKISCIEEIAFRMGYIDKDQLIALGNEMMNNPYGQYLLKIAQESL